VFLLVDFHALGKTSSACKRSLRHRRSWALCLALITLHTDYVVDDDDEPDSSRLAAPYWRIWSQLQIKFQSGAGTTSL
jgi:hypothetical protein